jgi:hypothetical protein
MFCVPKAHPKRYEKSVRRRNGEGTKQISLFGTQTKVFSRMKNATKNDVFSCLTLETKRHYFENTKRGRKSDQCKESFTHFTYYFSYSLATSHMYVDHLILSYFYHKPPRPPPFQFLSSYSRSLIEARTTVYRLAWHTH